MKMTCEHCGHTAEYDESEIHSHRLMCGDSTSAEDVARLMDGAKAELTFTDPPYELQTVGGGILKHANSMKQISANHVDRFDPANLLFTVTQIYIATINRLLNNILNLQRQINCPMIWRFTKRKMLRLTMVDT